jgi:hypothetical protein
VPQDVPWPAPSQEEQEITVEEYMPLGLSEEEAIQDSEIFKLFQWEGLGVQLHASTHGDAVVSPPLPPPPVPAPPASWGHAFWKSPPHAPLAPPAIRG